MNVFSQGFNLLNKSQKKEILLLFILLIIGVCFEIIGLGALVPAIGILSNPNSFEKYIPENINHFASQIFGATNLVYFGLSIIVLLYVIKSIFLIYLTWRQNKFSSNLTANLANDLFKGYLEMPYQFHITRKSSVPLSMIQNEISSFSAVTQAFIQLFSEGTILLGILFTLFYIFPTGTLFIVLFYGLSVLIFYTLSKTKLTLWGIERHDLLLKMNKNLLQGFGGIKDLKIYGRELFFAEKFATVNSNSSKIYIKVNTLSFVPRFFLELLAVVGLIGLIFLMLLFKQPLASILQSLGVFVAAAFRMIPSVNRIMISMQQIKFANVTISKLQNEFSFINENSIKNHRNLNTQIVSFENKLKFKNIGFSYEKSDSIFTDFNLEINSGEFVGIIGTSGSGKSTLVDLLLGLLKPNTGDILSDNISIHNNLKSWQQLIGYVPQTIYLTDDTLKNNIGFGIPESEIDITRVNFAIKAAQLDDYISSLPQGLDTNVGERGVKMSGGQRQRIGIARALYNHPKILVLDEATSALDNLTEHDVMESIYLMKNITVIIIAHRLSTLNKCNRIIEIKSGKIETIKEL